MTINSVSSIQSTPVTGLGTQTFNVITAGLYTVQTYFFLPWQTSDQPSSVANPPRRNVQTATQVADTAGSLNNKWWVFYTAGNAKGYYVWYNINAAGTDPEVEGLTGIEVAGATGATANTLATAARAAITAAVSTSLVVVSGATSAIILTNTQYGACTAAANAAGGDSAGLSYSTGTTGTFGYTSGLVVNVNLEGDQVMQLSNPAPTQAILGGSVRVQASAGDEITVVLSSLSTADAAPNAVKGIINIFQGS